jgi:hypothetical protein
VHGGCANWNWVNTCDWIRKVRLLLTCRPAWGTGRTRVCFIDHFVWLIEQKVEKWPNSQPSARTKVEPRKLPFRKFSNPRPTQSAISNTPWPC